MEPDAELRRKLILGMACFLAAQKYGKLVHKDLSPEEMNAFIRNLRASGCEFTQQALNEAEKELIKLGRFKP